jgi:crotonobetainyl-CoA:carnitine CoA-transferase CaiB-like acyl-CoA transferase
MAGPLEGVTVVDCSAYITGPLATMILADQGADVIKVEPPGLGDVLRYLGTSRGGISTLWAGCNRGKRSVTIDLRTPDGRDLLLRLVSAADVFVQNFRPGVVERLGIDEPALRRVREDLVYASITAFGPTGPWARKPAFDHVAQAASGMAVLQSDPTDGEPRFVRNAVIDKLTSHTAAQAITAALFARSRTGQGQHVRLSMIDTAIAFLFPDAMANHALIGDGIDLRPTVADSYRMIRVKDGYMAAAAITEDQVRGVFRALGRPEFADDPRFCNVNAILANFDSFEREVGEVARAFELADIIARLEAEDVPCAPVLSFSDLFDHPQVLANEMFEETEHPQMGTLRRARPAARFSATEPAPAGPAPALGEHTDEVLTTAGIPAREIADLKAKGIIG